ncbi:glycosyltransferase [Candidatus Hecatella orcuttiae]|jgi:UDP:flavonoid glycosyltransferase YjiC (YdhE family)|uniref:glycosyltransferase n=1 Tax=Candidatus Hecatella orcuttiae TaxID=1935119 RepID=UPI0028683701|nr:glycosyltransferase [Candidatus Hecatella orcuttiae]
MRILYTSCNIGTGHAFRTVKIGKELEKRGHEVYFLAGGYAYELLRKNFEEVYFAPGVSWYEDAGGVKVLPSFLNVFLPLPYFDSSGGGVRKKPSALGEFLRHYYILRDEIPKVKPDLYVSDGDLATIRAALRRGMPCVFITNITQPNHFLANFLAFPVQRLADNYMSNSSSIVIPDLPPPYTVCQYNLGNLKRFDNVHYVGSFSDMSLEPLADSGEFIYASISGPMGTRVKLADSIIPILSGMSCESRVSLGEPGSSFERKVGNCLVKGWVEERGKWMERALLVLFSGGHDTCFEVIKYGKPSICIPTQVEQDANAKKMQEMGCSIRIKGKVTSTKLKAAVEKIVNNYSYYKKNIMKLRKYASKFNGVREAVRLIEAARR